MSAVFLKEIRDYFYSPMAWIMAIGYLLMSSMLLWAMFSDYVQAVQSMGFMGQSLAGFTMTHQVWPGVVFWFGFLLMLLIPLVTMHLFAKEKNQGTIELLAMLPLSNWSIVLGKFLAALFVAGFLISLTVAPVFFIHGLAPIDLKIVGFSYLGLFGFAAAACSVGLFMSVVTAHELVAALMTFAVVFACWIGQFMLEKIDWWADNMGSLSLLTPIEELAKGVLSTSHLLFYGAWVFFWLFLTVRYIESRQAVGWEG